MKKYLVYINYLAFAMLGLVLLWLSFKQTNITEIGEVLQTGNYWVILPVSSVSVMVYLARVMRWQLLFGGVQLNAPRNYLFASLATGYLVNFAIPRLGEITRALVLKRSLNFPINTSLSTIILERLVDVLSLALILSIAFVLELGSSQSVLLQFTKDVVWVTPAKLLILLGFLGIATLVCFQVRKRKDLVSKWINELLGNLFSLLKIKQKIPFLFHTIIIWVGFYLMTYLWIFMFEESSKLSAYDAFLVMVLGVVARSLPIQAGSAGAYHFVVGQALLFLGVSLGTSNALAIVIHGFQTIITLVLGFSAYFWLLYKSKNVST